MRKPIFRNQWYYGKPPQLQINILKYIVSAGELSKKKAANVLKSNYSDISDAMDALIKRDFIRWSRNDTSTPNPERFYKITEVGLRALLAVNLSEQEFWKVIILLCISSKKPIKDSEFEEYYHQFENNRLGYSSIHGYFLQSHFFNNIVDQWLLDNNNSKEVKSFSSSLPLVKISQIVLECLALNRSITLSQLIEKSGLQEQQIKRVLGKYSMQSNNHSLLFDNVTAKSHDDTDIQRQIYSDYIMHTLIVSNGTSVNITYELSLFGVMLVMALVRYYYIGIDTTRCSRLGSPDYISNLFYKDIDMSEYYDKIAYSYKEKIPRLFGKWDLLKSQLGSPLLYNNFDLFIYEEDSPNRNINTTIWFGGNKEFYDDLRSLTCDARIKLYIIYVIGKDALENIQNSNIMKCANILPVHSKITELGQILSYIDIPSFVDGLKSSSTSRDRSSLSLTTHPNKIGTIEKVFGDELTFLFYLNLNTAGFTRNKADISKMQNLSTPDLQQTIAEYEEMLRLGISPKHRLMAILTKDKDVKQWFSAWIGDLVNYRSQTSERMSVLYDEVINSNKNIKQKEDIQQVKDKPVLESVYEEFDITKICSDIDSIML